MKMYYRRLISSLVTTMHAHNALQPHYGISTLVHVNDVRGHAAVLALFDEVIAMDVRQ
jgi:hypothetical protein